MSPLEQIFGSSRFRAHQIFETFRSRLVIHRSAHLAPEPGSVSPLIVGPSQTASESWIETKNAYSAGADCKVLL
jgi:hypothetical protein